MGAALVMAARLELKHRKENPMAHAAGSITIKVVPTIMSKEDAKEVVEDVLHRWTDEDYSTISDRILDSLNLITVSFDE